MSVLVMAAAVVAAAAVDTHDGSVDTVDLLPSFYFFIG